MVDKPNIERLHKLVESYIHPRAEQTVTMLVEAIKQVGFSRNKVRVLILGHSYDYAIRYIKPAFIKIAEELGFAPKDRRQREVRIGKVTYLFDSIRNERAMLNHNGVVFRDHYDGDSRVIRRDRL